MTENEAIEVLKKENCYECTYGACSAIECDNEECKVALATRVAVQTLEEIKTYRTIGTVEECRIARNLLKPVKVVHSIYYQKDRKHHTIYCGNCGGKTRVFIGDNFCRNCGAGLDGNE